jgi:hypothetical protein
MKKILFLLALFCWSEVVNSQIVEISPFDSFDLSSPPESLNNKRFYWTQYDNGKIVSLTIGGFFKGNKHGEFLYFNMFRDDYWVLEKSENYSNGILDGYWECLIPHGYEKGFYKKGEKDGLWIVVQDDEITKCEYKQGSRNGIYERTNQFHKIAGQYKKDKKTETWTTTTEVYTEIIKYKNDLKHGEYKRCTTTTYTIGNYKNDKKHGIWLTYNIINNSLEEIQRETYKNDILVE